MCFASSPRQRAAYSAVIIGPENVELQQMQMMVVAGCEKVKRRKTKNASKKSKVKRTERNLYAAAVAVAATVASGELTERSSSGDYV